jgi:hypothetical protein|tara:strand:- start:3175 stop:3822 length:648 start_codon:yes stop_codon:yes gene_type:complete
MSFTVFTNVITVLFCIAVLIQSVRMMRSLKQVREGQLDRTVGALDLATSKAQSVLSELKQTLSIEGTANARALGDAREVREELHLMIGIANAMAERLIEAASVGSAQETKAATAPTKTAKATRPARTRGTRPTQSKADTPKATKAAGAKTKSATSTRATAPSAKAPSAKAPGAKPTTVQPAAATEAVAKAEVTKKTPARTSRKSSARSAGVKEAA